MRKLLLSLAVIPSMLVALPSMANDHTKDADKAGCEAKKHHHKSAHRDKLFEELNLTEAQTAEIKALKKAYWQENRETMKSGWQARKEMMQLTYAESVDQAKLDKLIAESSDAYANGLADKAKLNSDIFSVLTPEQQQQLHQKMAEFKAKPDMTKN